MATKVSVKDVIEDSAKVEKVWDENEDFTMKDVTRKQFKDLRAEVVDEQGQIELLQRQLDKLTNSVGDKAKQLSKLTTRGRSGMRGYFGPDSTEYEQAGGTRSSDRKNPTRKPKA